MPKLPSTKIVSWKMPSTHINEKTVGAKEKIKFSTLIKWKTKLKKDIKDFFPKMVAGWLMSYVYEYVWVCVYPYIPMPIHIFIYNAFDLTFSFIASKILCQVSNFKTIAYGLRHNVNMPTMLMANS